MRRKVVGVLLVILLFVAGGTGAYYHFRLSRGGEPSFQGWIEADLVFVSPDEIGRIEKLAVREGSTVEQGSALFALDDDLQRAAVAEAEAAVTNARQAYERAKVLLDRAVGSQKTFDDAEAVLRTAEAKLNSAKTRLDRRTMNSPTRGIVQEVYFRVGETVQPGRPIVAILPPQNVKVRFFVPQAVLPTIRIGDRVRVSCDGCRNDLSARVSFIAAQAEFTPPVIYSLEERARLVFRIEAVPEHPENVRIGQPVSVALQEPTNSGSAHAGK
ncbi:MAG TPA: efflux RND transporter periplasmic adaptor subunit [Hyphomicrobiaceae bacterium]|nr:efflux RND transporter periplasmic adaptor subunit [Hyphomicrobiaceae bacterium]